MRKFSRALTAVVASVALLVTGSGAQAYQTESLFVYLDAGKTTSYDASVSTSAWNDISGNGRNGSIVNSGSVSLSGGALTFPGGYRSDDSRTPHVNLGSGFADFGTGITIETEAHFGAIRGTWERIFDFGNNAESDNIWLGRYSTSDEIALEIWAGTSGSTPYGRCKTADTVNAIPENAPSKKFTVTLDGTVCRIFIDGIEVETEVDHIFGSGYFDTFTNNPSMKGSRYEILPRNISRTKNYVGRSNWGSDAAFEGAVKYLRIYTTALTPQSVENNTVTSTPSYTLTYASTGADSGSAPAAYVGEGSVTLSSNTGNLAKSGHEFIGWATSSGQSTAISNTYNLTANTTLYPVFRSTVVVPGQPGTPVATVSNTTASLSWDAPTTGSAVDSYSVSVSPAGGSCTVSGLTASCSGLSAGTSYTFRVTATNSAGSSSPSAASNSVTAVAAVVVPGQPGTPVATVSNTSASLSWDAPTTGSAVDSYSVSVSPAGGSCTVSGLTASCSGLSAGTSYTFRVTATNSAGSSSPSAASNSVTAYSDPGPTVDPVDPVIPAPTIQVITPVGPGSNGASVANVVKPGGTHTISGTGLAAVHTIRIGNHVTSIQSQSDGTLRLRIPAFLSAGRYKIELVGAFGTVTQNAFFEVPRKRVIRLAAGFIPDTARLDSLSYTRVLSTLRSQPAIKRVVCDGSTSGTVVTEFDIRLARERANAVCSRIQQANPKIKTIIRISPSSGLGAKARSVALAYLNY